MTGGEIFWGKLMARIKNGQLLVHDAYYEKVLQTGNFSGTRTLHCKLYFPSRRIFTPIFSYAAYDEAVNLVS